MFYLWLERLFSCLALPQCWGTHLSIWWCLISLCQRNLGHYLSNFSIISFPRKNYLFRQTLCVWLFFSQALHLTSLNLHCALRWFPLRPVHFPFWNCQWFEFFLWLRGITETVPYPLICFTWELPFWLPNFYSVLKDI